MSIPEIASELSVDAVIEASVSCVGGDSVCIQIRLVSAFPEEQQLWVQDYYEDTDYNPVKNITWQNADGEFEISPLANPFMPYDQLEISNVSGGWYHVDKETGHIDFLGERTIARWYTMYATIIQCRNWLPDPVGGVVWMAQDNVATSVYIPIYCSVSDLPDSYKTPGRPNGYTTESAWWAFNRLGTLTAQRWGDMRHDVDEVWNPMQKEIFNDQAGVENKALNLYKNNPDEAIDFLTDYTNRLGNRVVDSAWKLGDYLWTKYDELF